MLTRREMVRRRTEHWSGSTSRELWRLYVRQRGMCAGCGIEMASLHLDHIVTRSRGGLCHIGNVQFLCGSCNSSKGNKHYALWKYQQLRGDILFPRLVDTRPHWETYHKEEIMRALPESHLWILNDLDYATWVDRRFVRPMDIGGSDGSAHSRILASLKKRGLVEQEVSWGLGRNRRVLRYRITDDGHDEVDWWKQRTNRNRAKA